MVFLPRIYLLSLALFKVRRLEAAEATGETGKDQRDVPARLNPHRGMTVETKSKRVNVLPHRANKTCLILRSRRIKK